MGLMTVEQYKASLNDGREVYYAGERVKDVVAHPHLKACVETAATDYRMAETPEYKELAVVYEPGIGELINRYYLTPRNADDLLKRHELMVTGTRVANGMIPFPHDIAADAMNAVIITANTAGNKDYKERAENYLNYLRKNDFSAAGAISDVKGDRSQHPSSAKQSHPDYYLRVVRKDKGGITVRGAKVHITGSAYFNEVIVLPCRNMRQEDADYAISFAIAANTRGVKHICRPVREGSSPHDFPGETPRAPHSESFLIFDDVFVPWERVFLCGEWEHTATLVHTFAYLHRHTAASYHIPRAEEFIGMAQAIAEYNGIEKISHVREKITDLLIYLNTMKALSHAACMDHVMHSGVAIPNPMICNIAKYDYANNWHNCVKIIQDIAGGLLATMPSYLDYENPDERAYMDKYLGGRAGIPTENRLRMMQLIRRLLTFHEEVVSVHAEGSLQSQRMMIFIESQEEIQEYKRMVEKRASIPTAK